MASKRLASSAVNWAAFAERVPANQKDAFRAFKARSDMFVSRVHKHPENMPKIDFAYYRSRLSATAMVDQFDKAYQTLAVPYPNDPKNIKGEIDNQEKEAQVTSQAYVKVLQQTMNESQSMLDNIGLVPDYDELTHQMFADYFPDEARNPVERPTFWPHTKRDQPENDPHLL